METKAAAKFAALLESRAAEGLDMIRIKDLKICGIYNLRTRWAPCQRKKKYLSCAQAASSFLMRKDNAHTDGVLTRA
jgi:hypothetical protein